MDLFSREKIVDPNSTVPDATRDSFFFSGLSKKIEFIFTSYFQLLTYIVLFLIEKCTLNVFCNIVKTCSMLF